MTEEELPEDEISPEKAELFENYRKGTIGPDETTEFFQYLSSLRDKLGKAFKLRSLVTTNFDYTEFDYKRLDTEWYRWRKRQAKGEDTEAEAPKAGITAGTTHEKAKEVSKGATRTLFSEIQEVGNLLVTQFSKNAADRGETLKDYVVKSVELREQYGDQIEALRQENDVLKTLCSMFAQALKPQFKQLAAARMYLDWTTGLMQLQALGIDLNQQYIDDITNRIEQAMEIRIM
jgi:hypothetical protein